jgi:carbonic anhydrase/SulP family sulfate permease
VSAAVNLIRSTETAAEATGCQHLEPILHEIRQSIDPLTCQGVADLPAPDKESFINAVARRNVSRAVETMLQRSQTLDGLVRNGRIAVVGAMYDVVTGGIEFLAAAEGQRVAGGGGE